MGNTVEVLVEVAEPHVSSAKASHDHKERGSRSSPGAAWRITLSCSDGTDRLIGQTARVAIDDASPFTLYGNVLTDQGIAQASAAAESPTRPGKFSLPLV